MNDRDGNALILVLNCGSSSIKFALFDADRTPLARAPAWSGKVEGITGNAPVFSESGAVAETLALDCEHPYHAALAYLRRRIVARLHGRRIVAIAHRVVHGGSKYFEPVRVDAAVLADLKSYIPLAPLHQPFALEAIGALLDELPQLPQVACFDTAFHRSMPTVEKMLPLPRAAWDQGLRRYGFHGLSYAYQAQVLGERYGDAARGRTIVAHLGSGASLCAMRHLQSVATTMGFSALDGLMMGTRCGALDPGAVIYLMEIGKLSLERVGRMLYHESGLLGVSGVSSDPRELLPREDEEPVREALALYVRSIVRETGALAATLDGLDMLAFTAGIGEHQAVIRERVCAGLGFLGVAIDPAANAAHAPVISGASSRVKVVVEAANEEWVAATGAATLIHR
ncbi:acetate kinase [Rhodanobacter sp. FW510-R12]|uniref:acetate/propionate family kinase n=1 Tax=unclassified Rhodanobacter TaxID=2621553 RepID=UPI0007A9DA2F|nr:MULTISPECIES: acetate/propionate family kinase [unclassified Rhodanobacter]KZC16317.1 acetate kinase [Rhodanobacter sp. FW104-R8]KZC26792.1 acetate kinase [Rhodanobacter sp. FW510-T8]KZC30436.1 acetate kinase [Rhodanobacter sp. FW510-R10]